MPIISARHKCPECGREWSMPVNTASPDWQEVEKAKMPLPTKCDSCKSKDKRQRGG